MPTDKEHVTSMVAILRASCSGQEQMYPSKNEIQAMAQKIIDYYPMLRDSSDMPYVSAFSSQLMYWGLAGKGGVMTQTFLSHS